MRPGFVSQVRILSRDRSIAIEPFVTISAEEPMSPRFNSLSLRVAAGLLLVAGIRLQAADGSLTGQLTDLQGRPIAEANVSAVRLRDSRTQETRSDSGGRFG